MDKYTQLICLLSLAIIDGLIMQEEIDILKDKLAYLESLLDI